jgi:hypothetical protein
MPKIHISIDTNERKHPDQSWGSWALTVTAGLDEEPEQILSEALNRVQGAINALSPDKRYPRYPINAAFDE